MKADERVNILLVDDQPGKLMSYDAILAGLGHNLIKAASGREALDLLLRTDVAVILIDVCMPELDGFDLASMIREHPRYRDTAIILVSAVLMEDPDRLKGYDAGALDYVTVPIIPEVLRAKVNVFVELYRKTRQLEWLNRDLESRVTERTAELEESVQQLTESEERFRLATEAMQGGISDWDLVSDTVRRSPGLPAILGYASSETDPGAEWWPNHIHPDDREAWQRRTRQAIDGTDGTYRVEYRAAHREGRWVWICEQGRVVRLEDGSAIRVVRHMTDITSQREAEELLKQGDRRKDQFLATLAHELRNPLAPLRNVVDLLQRKGITDEEFPWCREVIDRQVEHLTRLVDDLIDVSRITRDKLELRRERVQLAEILDGAAEATRPLIDKNGLELEVSPLPGPVWLMADRIRVTQVLINLLNNAAKFTPRGGRIAVGVQRVNTPLLADGGSPGAHIVLRVCDSGVGIEPDKLELLFEMFYQGSSSLDGSHRSGLGIGLTLVQRLVELHGGTVEAHSAGVGLGSEFVVRLPALAEPPAVAGPGEQALPAPDEMPANQRVLVADDNLDAAETLATLLRLRNCEVVTVHDGVAAVEAAAWFRPDIALLDIGMPHMTGLEVARHIRETPWGKVITLVALTGWGNPEDHRRAREAGFDAHLVKPVELATLFRVLSDLQPDERRPVRSAEA